MKLVNKTITKDELKKMAVASFGNLVKAVVNVSRQIMAVDAPLHADEEAYLLARGSNQADLWGINLYPDLVGDQFIEFDSMINIRPGQGNMTRGVDDAQIKLQIRQVVSKLVK